jgi:hypothetical protein
MCPSNAPPAPLDADDFGIGEKPTHGKKSGVAPKPVTPIPSQEQQSIFNGRKECFTNNHSFG